MSDACLVAFRDHAGKAVLACVTERAEVKWTRPLETDAKLVTIIGVRDRAFLLGASTSDGSEVLRYDRDGASRRVWHTASARTTPDLAWSFGRLLIAFDESGRLVTETIPLAN